VMEACHDAGWQLLGARFGRLSEELIDLTGFAEDRISAVAQAPGSAIGSSRRAIEDVGAAIESLRRQDVRALLYTGGNGSMAAALKLSQATWDVGYELLVIGIPKTIDNDLMVTHHTPGYASTAYFFACAAREVDADNRSLPSPVCVLETLGRNVGWIAAATCFANPHLIYFPERPLSLDLIAADVEEVYRREGRAVVVVCEGQLDEKGEPFGADLDRQLASNLGHTLATQLSAKLGIRVRAERPGLIGRSCGLFARDRDRRESYACGRAAVAAAVEDESEVMVALSGGGSTFLIPLNAVAGLERRMPDEFINEAGNGVTQTFRDYAGPLVGDVPAWEPMI